MRTIGVLGGIGPQATTAFEEQVHRAAQRVIEPRYNEGYPPMVSVYLRHAPVLVEDGRPSDPLTLDPRMLEAARKLGTWADLIAIPSNTPHFFLQELGEAAGCEMVSMIDAVFSELAARGTAPVGLLGLGIPKIYATRMEEAGIAPLVSPPVQRDALDHAILRLMEGRDDTAERTAARDALAQVRAQGAAVTVLGCTEIPLLLGAEAQAADLIDPAVLLAEEVVRRALTR